MVEINRQFIKKELQILFDEVSEELIDRLHNIADIEELYHDLSKDNDIKLSVSVRLNDHGEVHMNYGLTEQDWYNKYQIFSSVPTEQKQKEEDDCPELIPVPAPSYKKKKYLIKLNHNLTKNQIDDFMKYVDNNDIILFKDAIEDIFTLEYDQ